jgi:alkylhydroperoxidase/carboxymuconolactone decarboxylase family protein YurZ
MTEKKFPDWFVHLKEKYGKLMDAVDTLGKTAHDAGPLDEKTANLIQLAGAIGLRSEGAVHSHARRAKAAGATNEEIEHAAILLTSTVGFPNVSAALSWINDVTGK